VVDARVLARQRRDLTRDRARDITDLLAHQFPQPDLVRGVDIGVEQADRHTLDTATGQDAQLLPSLILVQRDDDRAVGADPLQDSAPQIPRHHR
jgi:hypothetical protein